LQNSAAALSIYASSNFKAPSVVLSGAADATKSGGFVSISAAQNYVCAIGNDKSIWCYNFKNQLRYQVGP
jgi:hypothetical protein